MEILTAQDSRRRRPSLAAKAGEPAYPMSYIGAGEGLGPFDPRRPALRRSSRAGGFSHYPSDPLHKPRESEGRLVGLVAG